MGGLLGDIGRVLMPGTSDQQLGNIGLSMIPGVGSYLGAQEANQANAAQSDKQMAFQERMSSTAHQREVEDLKKAGLNPILSMGGSGASSPQGSQAVMQNALEGLGTTGKEILNLMQAKKQLTQTDAQTELLRSQKNKADVEAMVSSKSIPEAEMKNDAYEVVRPLLKKLKEKFQSFGKDSTPSKGFIQDYRDNFFDGKQWKKTLKLDRNK